ncbi:hypothetical protein SB861_33075 [Paraburkholderia sp. SIMBA_049]
MDRIPRQELDLKKYMFLTLSNLSNCYTHKKPQATFDTFLQEIVAPIVELDDSRVEAPGEMLMLYVSESDKAKGPDWLAKSPYGPIIISCAYCVRAGDAIKKGDSELAWSYMADARYWCGVAISSKGIDEARDRTIVETREKAFAEALKSKGEAGAKARSEAYEPLREHVFELVRNQRPSSGWKSRSHAVKVISEPAYAFSLDYGGPQLKRDGIGKTLDGWLSKMPDALELFPPRSSKNKAKG